MKVLIAEDDRSHQTLISRLVRNLGHEVVGQAGNGRELITLAEKVHPDLIITDISMPELSGLEAAIQIRNTPVLVITGNCDAFAHSNMALVCLAKPVSVDQLNVGMISAIRLQESIQQRKEIERAKEHIMEREEVSGAKAHKRLQQLARDRRIKVIEVARAINTLDG